MRIQLNQTEIEKALREYIANQGLNITGYDIDVGFTAGRSGNGMTADLDITPAAKAATASKPVRVQKTTPAAVETAPVAETTVEAVEPVVEALQEPDTPVEPEPELIEEDDIPFETTATANKVTNGVSLFG